MFTGIVKATGTVHTIQPHATGLTLQITAPTIVTPNLPIGASIAVNGTCLTVTKKTVTAFSADVMAETVRRTNLSQLRPGQSVNLEPALTATTGLDGHFVLGHVDYCGRLCQRIVTPSALRLFIELPATYRSLVVEKGSVAIDGVSLTVVNVSGTQFEIDLIPHSQQVTTLGALAVNTAVNVETDIIGKYVARQLADQEEV